MSINEQLTNNAIFAHEQTSQIGHVAVAVCLGELGFAALDRLEEHIVDEYELLLGLHQVVPLLPDVFEERVHVYGAAVNDLLHHCVDHDVGAGAAHACRAMHHDRTGAFRIGARALSYERENRQNVVGHAVVRPVGEVVLID